MSFEPQKFFIGLVGFFSIILPGALLAYLGRDWITETFLDQGLYSRDGWEEWLLFLFIAYLLGHFAFLIGSTLDDLVYAPLRQATAMGQVRRLARGNPLSDFRLRRVATSRWIFSSNPDAAVIQAERIRSSALGPLGAEHAINAYQWSKVRLSREHPEGLLAVERFEADSKFFRSFSVVLFILVPILLWQLNLLAALLCALLVLPALWRYVDQRFKATQLAYWHLLALQQEVRVEEPKAAPTVAAERRPDGLTHAGGVVYRQTTAGAEYLLVETSGGGEWVLPKGHIEAYESPEETAVREVYEEAGVWARVIARIDDIDLLVNGRPIAVRFYLMEALADPLAQKPPMAEDRKQQWLPFGEVIAVATHAETRQLLAEADRRRI